MQSNQFKPGLGLVALVLAACGGGDGATAPASSPVFLAEAVVQMAEPPVDHSGQSLYSGPGPRPGPALLYAAAPRAPQLENTGIWKAHPILVSGASAYRRGEYLYQDYLYDDRGAQGIPEALDKRFAKELFARSAGSYSYPDDPVYANNAADIVELRIKPRPGFTAFRLTMNTLLDPEKLAFSIAIGDSLFPRAFPFGANVKAPAQYFLTVHGGQAVLTNALSGAAVTPAPTVTVDTLRRQFEVEVPEAAWSPGRNTVRIAAGAGLWDAANGRYLLPAALSSSTRPGGAGLLLSPSAFFNVAFRFDEPVPGLLGAALGDGNWRDHAQARALAAGDISKFHANVDFGKLADKVDDELAGEPQGVPAAGPINRIFASQVETRQGVDFSVVCGGTDVCKGEYLGQLQTYNLYLPAKAAPAGGYGLTLLLHSLAGNHNQYFGTRNQSQLGERGQGHLVATPLARGPDGWYVEDAEADVFEMWADVARNYRLNPAMSSVSGYSMGGYGTFMFATRYPDLFANAHASAAGPSKTQWLPPSPPPSGDATNTYNMVSGLRHVPILIWSQSLDEGLSPIAVNKTVDRLAELNYRHRLDTFPVAEHLTLYMHDSYAESANFLGDAVVERNPAHVSFVSNPVMNFPSRGLVADHAYWLSDINVRDMTVRPRGEVEAVSRAFGESAPVASGTQYGAGAIFGSLGLQAYVSKYLSWTSPTAAPASDTLEITARNVGSMSVNMARARLSCNALLQVDTDGPLTLKLEGCNRSVSF
ncbi:MAG: alpha/beta hydrolase-fold protein [Pseudomonadota bacterium]